MIEIFNFEEVFENIFLLRVPFEDVLTSVIAIKTGEGAVLFDSATTENDVKEHIIPALANAEICPDMLISSHFHADHMGGEPYLAKEYPEAVRAKIARECEGDVRRKLCDGDILFGCLEVLNLPGHTDDSLAILDRRTMTLVCADCLQQKGVGRYGTGISDAAGYLSSIAKLREMRIDNILSSHDYVPRGISARGACSVSRYLDESESYISELRCFAASCGNCDFAKISAEYNRKNPHLPPVGAGTFEACAKL